MPKSTDQLRDLTGDTHIYRHKKLGMPNTPATETTQHLYKTVLLQIRTEAEKAEAKARSQASLPRAKPQADAPLATSQHPVAISIDNPIQGLRNGLNAFQKEAANQSVVLYFFTLINFINVYLTTYGEFSARTGAAIFLEPTKRLLDATKDSSAAKKYSLRALGLILTSPFWCVGQTLSAAADALDAIRLTADALFSSWSFSSLKMKTGLENFVEGLARLAIPVATIVGISYFHEMSNLLIQSETAEVFSILYLLGAASATDKLVKAGVYYGQEKWAEHHQNSTSNSPGNRPLPVSHRFSNTADNQHAPAKNSTRLISIHIEELKEHKEEKEYKFMELPNSPSLIPPAQPDLSDQAPNFPLGALSPQATSSSSGSSSNDENKPFLKESSSTSRVNMADMLFSNSPSSKNNAGMENSDTRNPSTRRPSISSNRRDSVG